MKTMVYLVSLLFALGLISSAMADPESGATMEIFVEVVPNMSVAPLAPFIDMGTVQTGDIPGFIPFRVDANTQTCMFAGAASHLYKGDDPTNTDVLPIEVALSEGIAFVCPNANPTGGADNLAEFTGLWDINGFPGWQTEYVEFESSQNNHFSQDITMQVVWNQPDPEKPMGEYSGYVEFFAMVVP